MATLNEIFTATIIRNKLYYASWKFSCLMIVNTYLVIVKDKCVLLMNTTLSPFKTLSKHFFLDSTLKYVLHVLKLQILITITESQPLVVRCTIR